MVRHLALAAALGLSALSAQAASVLVVLSDSDHLDLKDGKVFQTGFYLNELMQPVKRLLDAGHQVTFATPNGLAPTLDKTSDDKMYFNNDVNAWRTHRALLDKLKLTSPSSSPVISLARAAQRGYGEFDAIYIPGGHAPMQDLLTSPRSARRWPRFMPPVSQRRWSATVPSRCSPRCRMRRHSPASWRKPAMPRRSRAGFTRVTG